MESKVTARNGKGLSYQDEVIYLLREILNGINRLKPKKRPTKQQLELWAWRKKQQPYGPSDVDPRTLEDRRTPEEKEAAKRSAKELVRKIARKQAGLE